MIKKIGYFCISLILIILQGCKSDEPAPVSIQAASVSLPIRWSSQSLISGPITLTVGDALETDFPGIQSQFQSMAALWDDTITIVDILQPTLSSVTNLDYSSRGPYQDSQMGIYKSTNWFPDISSNAIAITQYFTITRHSGSSQAYDELQHADIIVNFRDFVFRDTPTGASGSFDLVTVILHELGHFIGQGHLDDSSAVMGKYLSSSVSKRTLTAMDTNAILDLYSNYNTVALEFAELSNTAGDDAQAALSSPQLKVGVIELHSDGTCHHYINGKLVESTRHPRM